MRHGIWTLPPLLVLILCLGLPGCHDDADGTVANAPTTKGVGTKAAGQSEAAPKPSLVGDRQGDSSGTPAVLSKQTETSPFRFTEIAKESGIDFAHFSGMTVNKHFPTANGSGVAVFDYDNDGKLDIYFATATLLPLGTAKKGPNRLYKKPRRQ